ncbi:hypothetical protein Scep_008692 [Stephania cephalantha]|uniref:Uncharacterized protein n=1 Tax=Stephania cephalantha TaxID=152367 RepID=A0AAP0JRP3_9MAGN
MSLELTSLSGAHVTLPALFNKCSFPSHHLIHKSLVALLQICNLSLGKCSL